MELTITIDELRSRGSDFSTLNVDGSSTWPEILNIYRHVQHDRIMAFIGLSTSTHEKLTNIHAYDLDSLRHYFDSGLLRVVYYVTLNKEPIEKEESQPAGGKILSEHNIYDLPLHESMRVAKYTFVQRVPGGWLYNTLHTKDEGLDSVITATTTFVPYDREFFDNSNGCALCGK